MHNSAASNCDESLAQITVSNAPPLATVRRIEFDSLPGDAMQARAQRTLIVIAVLIGALDARAAQAAEWRYCLAVAAAQRTVYMSAPFPNDESMETIEAAFGRALDHALLQHDSVQCPRGDAQSIAAMKLQAIQFNQASGNKVVQLNWRP